MDDVDEEEEVVVWLVGEGEAIVVVGLPAKGLCGGKSRRLDARAGFSRVDGALYGQFKAVNLVVNFGGMYNRGEHKTAVCVPSMTRMSRVL